LRNNLTVNQSLNPEKIQTIELNYMATFGSVLSTNFSLYRNYSSDVVLRSIILTGANYASYFVNGAEIETMGAEFTLMAQPITKIRTEISVSYQNSQYKSLGMEDVTVEFSPKVLAYFKANYQINDNLSFSLLGNYVDKMESQWDNTPQDNNPANPPKGRIYGAAVDAYYLLGLNVRYDNVANFSADPSKGLYLNMKVTNLLDAEYHYPSTSVSAWADKGVLGNGRTFIVSAGYKF